MTGVLPHRPPVILLGMHRSGTSLLCRLLSSLGLFVGDDLQDDYESVFFIRCNDWILRQAGATWDYPEIFLNRVADPRWRAQVSTELRERLRGPRVRRFAGARLADSFRAGMAFDFAWGWKDPRNTFTLPVWLDLYPEARVIHLARHGVDVANSLVTREQQSMQKLKVLVKAVTLLWPRSSSGALANPLRCTSLDGAFEMWEVYLKQARQQTARLGTQAIEVVYESFLRQPVQELDRLCRFIELPAGGRNISRFVSDVVPGRAYAYRARADLQGYAERVASRLAVYGY